MSIKLKPSIFDVEGLQQLSYERSKKWAIFLNSICENEQDDPVHIDEIDSLYEEPEEEQEELASMEDEEYEDEPVDSEVLKDITNSSHNRLTSGKLSDTTLMHKDTHEIVDLLNQTMPVINEHNRQLKDYGLERILNTFDAKKIEEKVGGWLKRHNSLCVSNNNNDFSSNRLHYQTMANHPMSTKKYGKHVPNKYDSDSDDSFHSGETARYIRRVGSVKTSSSPTTMIKTYRTIERSRQALREKYACAQDYESELLHLKRLRHHRQHSSQTHLLRAHKMKQSVYKNPSQIMHSSRKRKVLRKRSTSNSYSARDTSSDSDSSCCNGSMDTFYCRKRNCCGQYYRTTLGGYGPVTSVKRYHHRGHVPAIPSSVSASVKRLQYRHAGMRAHPSCSHHLNYGSSDKSSVTSSPTSSPSGPFTCRRKVLRRHHSVKKSTKEVDFKYHASQENKMCQDYGHTANTSTGEWVVEETFISKKVHIEPHIEEMKMDNNFTVHEKSKEEPVTIAKEPIKSSKARKEKASALKKIKSHKSNSSVDASDNSFEEELKLAIQESKELYKKELLKSQKKTTKKERKTLVKRSFQGKRHLSEEMDMITSIDKTYVKSDKEKTRLDFDKNNTLAMEPFNTLNSLASTIKNTTIEGGSEETFFAASGRVCNSTALPNNKSACKREIEGDYTVHSSSNISDTKLEDENAKYSKKSTKEIVKKVSKSLAKECNMREEDTPKTMKINKSQRNTINEEEEDDKFIKPRERPKKRALQKSKSMPDNGNAKEDNFSGNSKQKLSGTEKGKKSKKSRKSLEIVRELNETEKYSTKKSKEETNDDLSIKVETKSVTIQKTIQDDNMQIDVEQNREKSQSTPSHKSTDNSNITSTTKSSADIMDSPRFSTTKTKCISIEISSEDDANDCTVVSSTTNIEPPLESLPPVVPVQNSEASELKSCSNYYSSKGILIYTPHNPSPNMPLSNDRCFVHISKEHLSSVIGEKPAEKFLKYYIGRRRFPKNSWIYFKPPEEKLQPTNGSSSSDSDLDDLDRIGKYGALYASDGGGGGNAASTDNEKP